MVVDEHDELPEATQREAELKRQIDDLQGQVTGLHQTREETNPELSSEFQILREKLITLQATGADRREAQYARIGESNPPRREQSP
ncbi:hypothetical protein HID58_037953 [Brassica napus]|uniref:Uncharacterized protein n=1 Tax=Brassica napus TaxID=3708 RepID=A0ABQ8BPL1_BRANA|nr:hypothetical protein HID58_037953 [Brassica napus]